MVKDLRTLRKKTDTVQKELTDMKMTKLNF